MSTETGSTIVGTPAGGATATAGTTTTQTEQQPQQQWYDSLQNAEAIAWAKGRGYKLDDPTEAARQALLGHFNAEKLIGLDRAGRTVALPKDDAPADEWNQFYGKLGRPADAKGYKVPDALKDDPVAAAFLDVAHKAGYSQRQLDPVFEFIGQQTEALQAQAEQQREVKAQADVSALRQEWGGEFELRSEAARRAVRELGLSTEQAQAIEAALGVKQSAELFFKIGKGLLEDRPEGMGGHAGGGAKFGLTPAEAQGKIQSLRRDQEFTAKMLKGDAQAKAEWDRLHQIAYPG